MKHTCPVCGYPDLEEPPDSHVLCRCCGTHHGYLIPHPDPALLREQWVVKGCPWWAWWAPPSDDWDPWRQLERAPSTPAEEAWIATVARETAP